MSSRLPLRLLLRLLSMHTMLPEDPRGRKFAEPMADHVLRYKNGNMRLAVMHGKSMPDKIGDNH